MKDFVVYILYSRDHDKTYCGQTGNLIARFMDHNKLGKKGWVRQYRPWEVIHVEFYKSRYEALNRERELKSGKGRDWIRQNLLKKL